MTEPQDARFEPRAAPSAELRVCRRRGCGQSFKPYRAWQECCSEACRRADDRDARQAGRQQLGLALTAPAARTTDPVTSHLAERDVTESGSRASHCALVLGVLGAARQPMTYREVARRLPQLEAVEVMRRLNDLRHESPPLVAQLDKRVCGVSGRPAVTWWPITRSQESAA